MNAGPPDGLARPAVDFLSGRVPMHPTLPACLGWFYLLSELLINRMRRPPKDFSVKDRYSYRTLWITIIIAMTLAFVADPLFPFARFGSSRYLYPIGGAVFAIGLALRWYSIFHLGRFFTVKVAIAADHRVIDTGPYRWIRHPSYAGGLLQFLGIALALGNLLSLVLIMVPVLIVYAVRIGEEERALTEALGEDYRSYVTRTRRLIPFLY